ncbi:hypothetical protein FQA39_LY09496 [Lamprigera yunnana]|nr:hypothetical protein FQA39_LY09496 [Lamprigera yunnana]
MSPAAKKKDEKTTAPAAATAVAAAAAAKALKKKASRTGDDDELEQWQQKTKQLLRPKDQVELSEAELNKYLARVLQSINTQYPDGLVEFNYELGKFVPVPLPGPAIVIYSLRGTLMHKDSEEARQQLIAQGLDRKQKPPLSFKSFYRFIAAEFVESVSIDEQAIEKVKETAKSGEEVEGEEDEEEAEEEEEEGEGGEGGREGETGEGGVEKETEEEGEGPKAGKKKLTNQFNFCERGALTYTNPFMNRETQTLPPPTATFSSTIYQWIIFDAYQQDYEMQQLQKELERQKREAGRMPVGKGTGKKIAGKKQLSEAVQGRVYECWRTLERMLNLNTYDYIAKDYRYWEDPADEFREAEGTLLPLWKFTYDKTKKNTVTDMVWNPYYYDLFAITLGYHDFMRPLKSGAILFFTIKNPSYPEYICMTESAVMCIDIHKKYPYMVAVGLFDGNVMVYNIQATYKEPAYQSNSVTQKHNDIVWEIKWGPDLQDGEMNFFSVSSDGKVNHWILMQTELSVTTILNLYLEREQVRGPDGTLVRRKACATCVTFHPKNHLIYLVGTEEGLIYKCSTAYSTSYLFTYDAHEMPIYRVDYNKLNFDIFISCSADWRIKIWEDMRNEALYVFDLGSCVGDVKWAPYSSTVFGAITSKGNAYIFDINVNKYKPICVQPIVSRKKYKLTRISFNNNLPVIICGDDKGCATALKLSPNLRLPCKPPKKQLHLDQYTLQLMKLDKLLALVREPATLTPPPDPAGSTTS